MSKPKYHPEDYDMAHDFNRAVYFTAHVRNGREVRVTVRDIATYDEAILVTPVGSLPIRTGRQFKAGRKLGKTHQNILMFCKGDPKRAAEKCNATT